MPDKRQELLPKPDVEGGTEDAPDARDDLMNIALLLLLYTLQGVPMGLAGAIPYMLQDKNVSYDDQAMFSLVSWPFSLKLFWAPIVDSVYLSSFGRRKTWLVPVQFAIGGTMLVLGALVDGYLSDTPETEGQPPNVPMLTALFFWMFFLCATQDIAVDGWALTMLQEKNKGYAATANTVGQTAGYFVAFTGFLALQTYNICTLAQFLNFWAVVFLVTTLLVWFMKHEKPEKDDMVEGVVEVYQQLYYIMKLPAIQKLVVVLFTFKLGFSAAQDVTGLKLMEYGVPKEHMASIMTLITPVNILLPFLIGDLIASENARPLELIGQAYVPRLLIGAIFVPLVYAASSIFPLAEDDGIPFFFYATCFIVVLAGNVAATVMFNAQMSFFAKIADAEIGATYMTLLNTIANLGSKWPSTLVLYLVEPLTTRECAISRPLSAIPAALKGGALAVSEVIGMSDCKSNVSTSSPPFQSQMCGDAGGTCSTQLDGYYVLSIGCFIVGVVWLFGMHKTLADLQNLDIKSNWHVKMNRAPGTAKKE